MKSFESNDREGINLICIGRPNTFSIDKWDTFPDFSSNRGQTIAQSNNEMKKSTFRTCNKKYQSESASTQIVLVAQ